MSICLNIYSHAIFNQSIKTTFTSFQKQVITKYLTSSFEALVVSLGRKIFIFTLTECSGHDNHRSNATRLHYRKVSC